MQQYGFRWPSTLDCGRLPKMSEQETSGVICAAPPDTLYSSDDNLDNINNFSNNIEKDKESSNLQRSKNTKNNLALSDISAFPPMVGIDLVEAKCECKCVPPFFVIHPLNNNKKLATQYHQRRRIQNLSNCAYACHSDSIYSFQDRAFLNTWILIWYVIVVLLL